MKTGANTSVHLDPSTGLTVVTYYKTKIVQFDSKRVILDHGNVRDNEGKITRSTLRAMNKVFKDFGIDLKVRGLSNKVEIKTSKGGPFVWNNTVQSIEMIRHEALK